MLLGLSATAEWFPSFVTDIGGATWEGIMREHEYVEYWAGLMPDMLNGAPRPDVWTMPPTPMCAKNSAMPDRVVFIAFSATTNPTYGNYANPSDPTVTANWVKAIELVVGKIQMHWPIVKRIELMTFPRSPTSAPNGDCSPMATSNHEQIVIPSLDDAIAQVVQNHPALVAATPKFYVGNCNWFNGPNSAHFAAGGNATAVAQMFADYYKTHP